MGKFLLGSQSKANQTLCIKCLDAANPMTANGLQPPATIGMFLSANDIILGTVNHYVAAGLCLIFIFCFVICVVDDSRQHNYGWIYQLTVVPVNKQVSSILWNRYTFSTLSLNLGLYCWFSVHSTKTFF